MRILLNKLKTEREDDGTSLTTWEWCFERRSETSWRMRSLHERLNWMTGFGLLSARWDKTTTPLSNGIRLEMCLSELGTLSESSVDW